MRMMREVGWTGEEHHSRSVNPKSTLGLTLSCRKVWFPSSISGSSRKCPTTLPSSHEHRLSSYHSNTSFAT